MSEILVLSSKNVEGFSKPFLFEIVAAQNWALGF
jgi:hypothetical protein